MKNFYTTYNIFQKAVAVFLIITLAWLTVSTPFIISTQQNVQQDDAGITWPCSDSDEDGTDSSSNTAEEKAPSGLTLSEEYLHEHYHLSNYIIINTSNHGWENMTAYTAFHGELHAPPPNAA